MKIRKMNENIDSDYIKECFIDFIDEGATYTNLNDYNFLDDSHIETLFEIFIDLPELNFDDFKGNFDTHIKKVNSTLNIYNDILNRVEGCIEKVKIKYESAYAYVIPEDETCIHIEIRRKLWG